jgi:N-acyl homoserine lactone hydrolase
MERGSWSGGVKPVQCCALAVALLALLAGQRAVAGQRRPQPVQSVRLYVLDCGVLVRGEPTAYNLTTEQVGDTNFADACYLVVHPKGTLIWDVGIIPDAQITPGGVSIPVGRGGNVNKAQRTLSAQLAEVGYTPADITFLAMSHSHGDHVANANAFAASTWLVQKAERDVMFSEQAQKGAAFSTYSALRTSKTVDLSGDHDVFGDGAVVLKSTPGHTPGHQSLYVKLARTGGVVLTGDLYHYAAERTLGKIPNSDNQEQTRASRASIEAFLKQTGAQLWIQHDIGANAKLKKAPDYYD